MHFVLVFQGAKFLTYHRDVHHSGFEKLCNTTIDQ